MTKEQNALYDKIMAGETASIIGHEDKLDLMYDSQKIYNSDIQHNNFLFGSVRQRDQYIKDQILYATHEMHELLSELSHFKDWQETNGDEKNLKVELIDSLRFLFNIALALNMSPDEICNTFLDKVEETYKRL